MRPLSEATARVSGKTFSRKYIALGRIVNCWAEIVGERLAEKAQPVKIHYRKHEKSRKPEATLDIASSSADATLLHYQKDLILERINQLFGDQWITAIRFVTVPVNQGARKIKKPRPLLTPDEKSTLSVMLEAIEDADIRKKLEGLGQEVMIEGKQ